MPLHSKNERLDFFPSIFSNREDNEADQDQVQNALENFYFEIVEVPREAVRQAQRSISRLLELVIPRLRRNRFGFRYGSPILCDQLFENLKTIEIDIVEMIIPLTVARPQWENHPTEPGYVLLPLPEPKKDMMLAENPWRHFKSKDGKFLSPMQVIVVTWALLRDALVLPWPVKGFEMMSLKMKTDGCVIYLKDREINLIVRIIIGLRFDDKENCLLYSKPFPNDHDPRSDFLWRLNYVEQELKILKAIEPADRFRRAQALKTICAFTKLDPVFKSLSEYQILTVLFHICDDEMHEKTWHKKTLKDCFYLILNKLFEFLKDACLPHFFIKDFNLLKTMSANDRKLLMGRIKFIMSNDKELIRVCRRRALNYKAMTQSLNIDPEIREAMDPAPDGCDEFYQANDNDLGEEFKVEYVFKKKNNNNISNAIDNVKNDALVKL